MSEDALTKFLEMSGINMGEYKHVVRTEESRNESTEAEKENV